ncbi:MAG: hypothetical protein V4574_08235 [Pseudomonadota bacterium]
MPSSRKNPPAKPATTIDSEQGSFLMSLRAHRKVIAAGNADAPLPEGVTHVLVNTPGEKPRLIEKRKSFF